MSYTEKHAYFYDNDTANANDGYGLLYNWTAAMDGDTVEGGRGICPEGWHVPTDAEWTTLMNTAVSIYQPDVTPSPAFGSCDDFDGWEGGNTSIVKLLNDCTFYTSFCASYLDTIEYDYQNGLCTQEEYIEAQEYYYAEINDPLLNATGFSALPAGSYYMVGEFYGRDIFTGVVQNIFFWSSSPYDIWSYDVHTAYTRIWSGFLPYGGIIRVKDARARGFSVRCLRD